MGEPVRTKLIILDRDGVINKDSPHYIKTPEEWIALPGSLAAIAKLKQAGLKVVVVTNQSGISRGYFTEGDLEKIHHKMLAELMQVGGKEGKLDGILVCPHGPNAACNCRKPRPGLLLEVAKKFALTPAEIILIGDSLRDLQAAKTFGCAAILVKTGNGTKTLAELGSKLNNILVFSDLAAAAVYLVKDRQK